MMRKLARPLKQLPDPAAHTLRPMRVVASLLFLALPLLSASNWKLVWSDEFNGPANSPPDPTKWIYDLGAGGWGNQELETYTDNPENVFQDGSGHLVIRAVKTASGGFTSARIKTLGKFAVQYGKIEARIKIPHGQGIWPAFWMLGDDINTVRWPKCGEIDVMENIGKEPAVVHGTVHGPRDSAAYGVGEQHALSGGQPLSADFHVYGIEWSRHHVRFFLDGKRYFTASPILLPDNAVWAFEHPFFLLLNLAVGGGWPGNPDATTVFPQDMLVDWVRVSQRQK
jgi:beta-glucanase (GH16 family)